jgi:hypothetical protein
LHPIRRAQAVCRWQGLTLLFYLPPVAPRPLSSHSPRLQFQEPERQPSAQQAIALFTNQGEIMESEIIVVLVLIALAVGFIIWVRSHSHADGAKPQRDNVGQESRATKKS